MKVEQDASRKGTPQMPASKDKLLNRQMRRRPPRQQRAPEPMVDPMHLPSLCILGIRAKRRVSDVLPMRTLGDRAEHQVSEIRFYQRKRNGI